MAIRGHFTGEDVDRCAFDTAAADVDAKHFSRFTLHGVLPPLLDIPCCLDTPAVWGLPWSDQRKLPVAACSLPPSRPGCKPFADWQRLRLTVRLCDLPQSDER